MRTGAPSIEVDTRKLQSALALYAQATGKDEEEILNKAAKNVLLSPVYGVIKRSPRASKDRIEKKLMGPDKMALKLAARNLGGPTALEAKHYTKTGKLKKGSRWQKRVGKEARRIIGARKRASGFLAAGWLDAAVRGGFSKRKQLKSFAGAGRIGGGIQARATRLVAEISNHVEYADKKGHRSLKRAVKGAAKDMGGYAKRKMKETAKRYNGKRK